MGMTEEQKREGESPTKVSTSFETATVASACIPLSFMRSMCHGLGIFLLSASHSTE